jgi:hypothetical protein
MSGRQFSMRGRADGRGQSFTDTVVCSPRLIFKKTRPPGASRPMRRRVAGGRPMHGSLGCLYRSPPPPGSRPARRSFSIVDEMRWRHAYRIGIGTRTVYDVPYHLNVRGRPCFLCVGCGVECPDRVVASGQKMRTKDRDGTARVAMAELGPACMVVGAAVVGPGSPPLRDGWMDGDG